MPQSTTQKHATELEEHLKNVQKFQTNIWLKKDGIFYEAEVTLKRGVGCGGEWRSNLAYAHCSSRRSCDLAVLSIQLCCPGNCPKDIPEAFKQLAKMLGTNIGEPLVQSIVVHMNEPEEKGRLTSDWSALVAVKPNEVLYQLTQAAWCELFEITVPDMPPKKPDDPVKYRKTQMRDFLFSLLQQGQPGVTRWNGRPVGELAFAGFKECDFSKMQLEKISMKNLDGKKSKFDGADLQRAELVQADVTGASFVGANLEKAKLSYVQAAGANFSSANLGSANLFKAKLQNAIFKDADLSNAEMRKSDLRGVDLTVCKNLALTNFHGATYDEHTILPPNFPDLPVLIWKGSGGDPYKASQKQAACVDMPTNFPGFIKYLHDNFDNTRLKKALSMLKKETFQLYSQVAADHVVGIVKSQTDKKLVYSCRLTADGRFACCTQNLKPCGGLQGMVCKHILVLVIGLTHAEQLTPADGASWIVASTFETPQPDMDAMAEVFLRYQGAAASDVDWRPTETIPEDYYAY